MKHWTRTVAGLTLVSLLTGGAFAQAPQRQRGARQGGPGSQGSSSLERGGLRVGQQLPEVTIYDARGEKFPISRVKGKYAVLVFGCLT